MWATRDPDGLTVVLTDERWDHVIFGHPYIGVSPEDVIDAVAWPDARMAGPGSGEEWFYREGAGPSAWMRVVVHYEDGQGLILTAFPRRAYP